MTTIMKRGRFKALGAATLLAATLAAGAAQAVPVEVFNLDTAASSSGIGAGTWGTVTVTQVTADKVDVLVTLAAGVKIINTGGPHTPFAFNITNPQPVSPDIVVIQPTTAPQCAPAAASCFTPVYGSAAVTPFGTLTQGFDYSGGNGTSNGHAGPLEFTISLTGIGHVTNGLFDRFVPNSDSTIAGVNPIFAADLSVNGNTGSVASTSGACTPAPSCSNGTGGGAGVPEPASMMVLGLGLLGLGAVRRLR